MVLNPSIIQLLMFLRRSGIQDAAFLNLVEKAPRGVQHTSAFEQIISARRIHALNLTDRMRVLEIGYYSFFQTYLLSRLSRRVYVVDQHTGTLEHLMEQLEKHHIHNITVMHTERLRAFLKEGFFDRVVINGFVSQVPQTILSRLTEGGILSLLYQEEKGIRLVHASPLLQDRYEEKDVFYFQEDLPLD